MIASGFRGVPDKHEVETANAEAELPALSAMVSVRYEELLKVERILEELKTAANIIKDGFAEERVRLLGDIDNSLQKLQKTNAETAIGIKQHSLEFLDYSSRVLKAVEAFIIQLGERSFNAVAEKEKQAHKLGDEVGSPHYALTGAQEEENLFIKLALFDFIVSALNQEKRLIAKRAEAAALQTKEKMLSSRFFNPQVEKGSVAGASQSLVSQRI